MLYNCVCALYLKRALKRVGRIFMIRGDWKVSHSTPNIIFTLLKHSTLNLTTLALTTLTDSCKTHSLL